MLSSLRNNNNFDFLSLIFFLVLRKKEEMIHHTPKMTAKRNQNPHPHLARPTQHQSLIPQSMYLSYFINGIKLKQYYDEPVQVSKNIEE